MERPGTLNGTAHAMAWDTFSSLQSHFTISAFQDFSFSWSQEKPREVSSPAEPQKIGRKIA
jgi:hypothetical protein